MAERTTEGSQKAQLIAEIERSRGVLGQDLRNIARAVDVPVRIGRHLSSPPVRIAVGSLVAGLVASLLLGKKGGARTRSGVAGIVSPLLKRAFEFTNSPQPKPAKAAPEFDMGRAAKAFWQALK